jgi:hypothetical protein
MVLILKTQSVEKILQEISRFNLSTDFVEYYKIHSSELKKRFWQPLNSHCDTY